MHLKRTMFGMYENIDKMLWWEGNKFPALKHFIKTEQLENVEAHYVYYRTKLHENSTRFKDTKIPFILYTEVDVECGEDDLTKENLCCTFENAHGELVHVSVSGQVDAVEEVLAEYEDGRSMFQRIREQINELPKDGKP